MRVAGADVWKGKWIVVVLADGKFAEAFCEAEFADAVASLDDCVAIGVDMPIGLPPGGERRPADTAARTVVGPRSSSVFSTPPLELLMCASAAEANGLARERGWPGISAQAFGLKKQILAVGEVALDVERIWEVHPEVSFSEANDREPLAWSKTSWNGAAQRRRILHAHGITLSDDLGRAGKADVPDVLDAAIAAWSAHRIANGARESLPEGAERIGAIWR